MFSFYFQHTSCFEGLMSSIPNYWVFFFFLPGLLSEDQKETAVAQVSPNIFTRAVTRFHLY